MSMRKFYNLTLCKYRSSHKLIKHLNLTIQIQICEKEKKPRVEDQWYNKEEEPQSLWSISIQFGKSQQQSKRERMRI